MDLFRIIEEERASWHESCDYKYVNQGPFILIERTVFKKHPSESLKVKVAPLHAMQAYWQIISILAGVHGVARDDQWRNRIAMLCIM
jgi:hypothetical protein